MTQDIGAAERDGRLVTEDVPAVQEQVTDGRAHHRIERPRRTRVFHRAKQVVAGHGELVDHQQVGLQNRQTARSLVIDEGGRVCESLGEVPYDVRAGAQHRRARRPTGRCEQPQPPHEGIEFLAQQLRLAQQVDRLPALVGDGQRRWR